MKRDTWQFYVLPFVVGVMLGFLIPLPRKPVPIPVTSPTQEGGTTTNTDVKKTPKLHEEPQG